MPLSTSSFDGSRWSRLRAVALTAIGVLALYGLIVQLWAPPTEIGQNGEVTTRIRMERYLDVATSAPIVLVGSSLSVRLTDANLGSSISNLGITGGSALTGLDILARSHQQPRTVVIEADLLSRPIDKDLVGILFREPWASLRPRFKVLQYRYRPMNLIYALLKTRHGDPPEPDVPPAVFQLLLQDQIKSQSQLLDTAWVKDQVAEMRDLVKRLSARGIKPVFMTIPVDPALVQLPQMSQVRQALETAFPKSQYCWISPTLPGTPRTRDGLHLVQADAAVVAAQVKTLVDTCGR